MHAYLDTVSDGSFRTLVTTAPGLIIVEFGGDWCAPCVALEPRLVALAEACATRVKIYKLDSQANPKTPLEYAVRGLPTLLWFQAGQVVHRSVGLPSLKALRSLVDKLGA